MAAGGFLALKSNLARLTIQSEDPQGKYRLSEMTDTKTNGTMYSTCFKDDVVMATPSSARLKTGISTVFASCNWLRGG